MISPSDLRAYVIRPTCNLIGLGGAPVEELLLGTAAQESDCGAHLAQLGGPALGVWQMEPATHDDLWKNFIAGRPELGHQLISILFLGMPKLDQLRGNLYYACAMARVQYFRSPRPIPSAGNIQGQAELYCAVYNTALGKATVDQYVTNARRVLGG